jgi:hypothetical protein
VIPSEQAPPPLPAGTPLVKPIPPRLVEPYLAGRRTVIAGYLYRAADCHFREPADYYRAMALGYQGSDFHPGMAELYLLRWLALEMPACLIAAPAVPPGGPASTVPEFFMLPAPIPVGTEIWRVTPGAEEFIARYDGQAWLRPLKGQGP